jgi:FkbM family methyltransferase
MKQLAKSLFIWMTSSKRGQAWLGKLTNVSQFLMGIGAGSDVDGSGEAAVFRRLPCPTVEPMVVFDIGANMGQFLALAKQQLKEQKAVFHCFEPGATGYAALQSQHAASGDVVLNNCAVGRERGRGELWYDQPGSGLASLTRRDVGHFGIEFGQSESVTITTIDAYCAERAISRIDLLKMDIEGHELDALEGATTMFERRAVGAVLFEFGGCNIDTRTFFRDFWHFFEKHQMRVYRVTPGGFLCPIERYAESLEQFRTTNFLAIAAPRA